MAYGSFGFRGDPIPGHWHATGPPRGYRRRRYRRRRSVPNRPDSPGTQMMVQGSGSDSALTDTARQVLASPAARRAIANAVSGFITSGPPGAISGAISGALSDTPQLALPPPSE